MEEDQNIEQNIGILRAQLKEKLPKVLRAEKLSLLRYYLAQIEDEKEKIKYIPDKDNFEYSESLKIAIFLIQEMEILINNESSLEDKIKYNDIMKQQYYYLAKYMYCYFAVAIEFGIPKEKQFLAPRTCILNYVNWELTKFYYRERGVMTISMPQGTRENRSRKKIYGLGSRKEPRFTKNDGFIFCKYS